MKFPTVKNLFTSLTLLAVVVTTNSFGVLTVQTVKAQSVPTTNKTLEDTAKLILKESSQIVTSLGYSNNLASDAISLETKLATLRDTISFTIDIPADADNAEATVADVQRITKCRDAINKIGAGSEIQSLSITAALKPSVWANIIGGGAAETAQLSAQSREYSQYKTCIEQYLTLIKDPKKVNARNLNEANRLNNYITLYTNSIANLTNKITDLDRRASSGWKDIAKATLLTMILRVNQNVTTTLLNKAMDKYKINDYLKYADALATQVYSMKYIDQNYEGDEETKMILRSVLTNSGSQNAASMVQIKAEQAAQTAVQKTCDPAKGAYEYGTWANLRCLAAQAAIESSPMYQVSTILDQAAQAQSAGQKAADQELADSQGYAPVRTCSGVVSEQQAIDSQWGQASTDVKVAKDTLTLLYRSSTVYLDEIDKSNLSPQRKLELIEIQKKEVATAEKAVADAESNYSKLKNQRVTGNIIDICEAISSPSTFIANSLDAFLKQHLDQATQLKTENLPFFAKFFSDVASNFVTKVISGAFDGTRTNKKVLKESGVNVLTGSVATEDTQIKDLFSRNNATLPTVNTVVRGETGDVDIYLYPSAGSATEKTLTITEGESYNLVIDFKSLVSQNLLGLALEGIDSVTGEFGNSGNLVLTDEQKQSGVIVSSIGAVSAGFSLEITFYSSGVGGVPVKLGTYTQTFSLSPIKRNVEIITPPEPTVAEDQTNQSGPSANNGSGNTNGNNENLPPDNIDGKVQGQSVILPRGPVIMPRG